MEHARFDVVVIGGGPAGATAASTLAQAGRSVAVCEQATFPRFHIGESLLPAGNEVLAAIGAWDKVEEAGFVRKWGADFETADGSVQVHNVFANGLHRSADYTYQVERSRFDQLLLEHAHNSGALVYQPTTITEVVPRSRGWRVRLGDGRLLEARFLIDASGRKTFLARSLKLRRTPLPYQPKVALYGHFRDVGRAPDRRGGNIVITRWRDGWFWRIPLDAQRTSVGLVVPVSLFKGTGAAPQEFFEAVVGLCPTLAAVMAEAKPEGPFHVTADYTYAYEQFAGDRFLLAGDAACFIDPIFSSGVCLALKSGFAAAQAVLTALRRDRPLSSRAQRRYTRQFNRDVGVMRGLIDTYYDRKGVEVFLRPSDQLQLFGAVNALVGGRTDMPWPLRWRYALFHQAVRWHRRRSLVEPMPDDAFGQPLTDIVQGQNTHRPLTEISHF